MAKEKLVWLGKGVFTRGGKTYKAGDIMPDGIDSKELKSLKKNGKIVKIEQIFEVVYLMEWYYSEVLLYTSITK